MTNKLINANKYQKALEVKAKEISNEDTINGICGAVALLFEQEDALVKIKEEIHKYLWDIGFTGWINMPRYEIEEGIFKIINNC